MGVKDKLAGKASEISGVQARIPTPSCSLSARLRHTSFPKLAAGPDFVVEKSNVKFGADWTERPKGTGPFTLEKWTHRSDIVLEPTTTIMAVGPKSTPSTYGWARMRWTECNNTKQAVWT